MQTLINDAHRHVSLVTGCHALPDAAPTGCSRSAEPSTMARSAAASGSVSDRSMTYFHLRLPQPDLQFRGSLDAFNSAEFGTLMPLRAVNHIV